LVQKEGKDERKKKKNIAGRVVRRGRTLKKSGGPPEELIREGWKGSLLSERKKNLGEKLEAKGRHEK